MPQAEGDALSGMSGKTCSATVEYAATLAVCTSAALSAISGVGYASSWNVYGITDVKKACDEASKHGITVFALAMAKAKQPHLSAMFGEGGYEVLVHPDQLADRLSRAEAFFRR